MTALLVFLFVVLPLLTVWAMFEDANDTHAGDVPYDHHCCRAKFGAKHVSDDRRVRVRPSGDKPARELPPPPRQLAGRAPNDP